MPLRQRLVGMHGPPDVHVDTHANEEPDGWHTGAEAPHTVPHAPQLFVALSGCSQPFDATASQSPQPPRHVNPQLVPLHVAIAFAGTGHGEHDEPHEFGDVFGRHCMPHAW